MSIFKKKYELYKITDSGATFNLTNSNRFITYNNEVYEPAPIDRDRIQLKAEMEKLNVTFEVDLSHVLAQRYLSTLIEDTVFVTVFENFDGQYFSLWRGRLVNVSVDGDTVGLKFESATTKQLKTGASRRYQRTCPYALYGDFCKADKSAFTHASIITGTKKNTINAAIEGVFDESYFVGGMIGLEDGTLRYITETEKQAEVIMSKTDTITTEDIDGIVMRVVTNTVITYGLNTVEYEKTEELPYDEDNIGVVVDTNDIAGSYFVFSVFSPFKGSVVGFPAYSSAGCDKRNSTCANKFNNILNFGGFPFIPLKNPFENTIV